MKANEKGQYNFDAVWKTLDHGKIELQDNRLTICRNIGKTDDTHTFVLDNASGEHATLRTRTGTPGPVKMLVQRHAAILQPEDQYTIQNLLYRNPPGQTRDYTLHKRDDRTALLHTPAPLLLGTGHLHIDDLQVTAAQFCISEQAIAVNGATDFRLGAIPLSSETPFALELHLPSGETTIFVTQQTEISRRNSSPLQIKPGTHRILLDVSDWETSLIKNALTSVRTPATSHRAPAIQTQQPAPLTESWSIPPESATEKIHHVIPWRVPMRFGETPAAGLLVCQGRKLKHVGPDGVIHWTFTTKGVVRCVTSGDIDGDGQTEILCGGDDEHIHILDQDGHERSHHHLTERLIVGQGGTENPCVNVLLAQDVNNDGHVEIVAGCTNSQLSMFDIQFNRLWNRGGIYHGAKQIQAVDLYGDNQITLLVSDHYGSVHAIGPDGKEIGRAYAELGDVAFDAADINADGSLEIINGSGTGTLVAFNASFEPIWQFNNYGYNFREVLCLDPQNNGYPGVLVASDTGFIYCLDSVGAVRWQADLGAPVTCLTRVRSIEGNTELAAGLSNGMLYTLNLEGQCLGTHHGNFPIKTVLGIHADKHNPRQIVAIDSQNQLRVFH